MLLYLKKWNPENKKMGSTIIIKLHSDSPPPILWIWGFGYPLEGLFTFITPYIFTGFEVRAVG